MTVHALHRTTDPETSRLAAESIEPHLSEVQRQVLFAFELNFSLTDEELSQLLWFKNFGESTARGRRSELTKRGLIVDSGERRKNRGGNMVIVWRLKPKDTLF